MSSLWDTRITTVHTGWYCEFVNEISWSSDMLLYTGWIFIRAFPLILLSCRWQTVQLDLDYDTCLWSVGERICQSIGYWGKRFSWNVVATYLQLKLVLSTYLLILFLFRSLMFAHYRSIQASGFIPAGSGNYLHGS